MNENKFTIYSHLNGESDKNESESDNSMDEPSDRKKKTIFPHFSKDQLLVEYLRIKQGATG